MPKHKGYNKCDYSKVYSNKYLYLKIRSQINKIKLNF